MNHLNAAVISEDFTSGNIFTSKTKLDFIEVEFLVKEVKMFNVLPRGASSCGTTSLLLNNSQLITILKTFLSHFIHLCVPFMFLKRSPTLIKQLLCSLAESYLCAERLRLKFWRD